MRRLMIPIMAGLGLLALLLALLGGREAAPQYDPIAEQARLYDLQRRQQDDAATAPARQLGASLWAVAPPVLLLTGLGALIATFVLDRRARRRRLEPDANGMYPLLDPTVIARELAPELAQHIALTMTGGNMAALVARHTAPPLLMGRQERHHDAPELLAPPEPAGLPTAPSWAELQAQGWRPSTARMLLGYGAAGPVYGGIDALLSTAIAGRPGQGKTTALRFVYGQTVQAGGQVAVIDPHGSIVDALGQGHALWTASTAAELGDAAGWLQDELERRGQAWKGGERRFTPLLLLCDEWPVVGMLSKPAVEAASRVILEARKWGIYALISGQGLPADKFGGSLVRDALSSRYVFRTTAAQGRMAGLDNETARLVEGLDVGRCILDGPVEPQIVAIPNTTSHDLAAIAPASQAGARSGAGRGMDVGEASPLPGRPEASDVRAARIRQMVLEQRPQSEIIKELWGASGGNSYKVAAQELAGVVAQLVAGGGVA